MSDDRLIIFDTTLRDGEQSPGASMNLAEKLEVARALRDLGVDVIEAGFPIASPGDFEAVQAVARAVHGPIICGLARCNAADIDRAWAALADAPRPRIHVFLATSAIHREFKLHMAKEEIIRRAVEGVKRPRLCGGRGVLAGGRRPRTELDFLAEVVDQRAVEAEAPPRSTFPIPSATPCPSSTRLPFAICGSTSAGLRTSSSASIATTTSAWPSPTAWPLCKKEPRQVECTINGIGERAGNCALEEIVMAKVRTRARLLPARQRHCNTKLLYPLSRKVAHVTGLQVQGNKAIVGQNAFAHEAGIHQDGMLKHAAAPTRSCGPRTLAFCAPN